MANKEGRKNAHADIKRWHDTCTSLRYIIWNIECYARLKASKNNLWKEKEKNKRNKDLKAK